ncbi:GumC family protein [Flagellimonas sp.]|uniref:GumC family protein n=1 Tax=Flagellimonas sp. TaxID=2058762 RepID=UPI003B5CA2D7
MESKLEKFSIQGNTLADALRPYTRNWKWFVFCGAMAIVGAFLYVRYVVPKYKAQAKIQILDEQGSSSDLSLFQDLEIFTGATRQVEDEIEIINSRSNHIEVVKKLKLNEKIILLGNIKNTELYESRPFNISFIEVDSLISESSYEFYVTVSTNTTLSLSEQEDGPERQYAFGQNIKTTLGDIVIIPNPDQLGKYIGKRCKIVISPVSFVAELNQDNLIVSGVGEQSNIVNLSFEDPISKRGVDIISSLILTYNRNAVTDKKEIADRTSDFINERITSISSSLTSVDQSAEEFKAGRGITDIASEANINLNIGANNRQELQNANVQLNIASSMKDLVDGQDGYEVLPVNIGLTDASIANTTARYNELALERKRLLKSSNEKNPIIVNLDQQLDGLRRSLQSSLNGVTNNLGLTVNSLSKQQSQINSRIYAVPENERALRDITRRQQTTEGLYLYLLQKREESQIAYASAAPKSKIVDRAYASSIPVSPKIPIVYMASLVLGFLVPFSVIYVKDLLDNKIHNKAGLEKTIKDTPVLAELPKVGRKQNMYVVKNDRSVLAESLRILRTNLDYLMKSKKNGKKGNVIFVTSSVPGEGKTFVSSNLAMILSSTNKKVILIGADIRNPKLHNFFADGNTKRSTTEQSLRRNFGLTEYLYDNTLDSTQIISSEVVNDNYIDVIYSGKTPPNPAELLLSERLSDLISEVSQKYDYVIVDTAPVMVVTDTLLISHNANQIIYVTRAGVTETKALEFPLKLKEEGKLKGLSFVVNDVKETNLGYGGKYGYGYGKASKKWWRF